MNEPLRVGVIGAGWFASRRHIPDLLRNEHTELTAICRRDEEAMERMRQHFQPGAVFTNWRTMLDECPLDAVIIATPHDLHFEPAKEAIQRGLHVLLEKPMTVRAAEGRELASLAQLNKRVLAVALNPPFWAHCHRMRSAIRSGAIGDIEAVSLFWTGNAEVVFGEAPMPDELPGIVKPTLYRADPAKCGGGYFIDGGSHLVSEVLWVTGRRAIRVSCQMDHTPSDRRTALAITLDNGAVATVVGIGNSRHSERRVRNTFAGTEGTVKVEGFEFQTTITHGGESDTFAERDLPSVDGPVDNFVAAIRGRADLYSPAEHGAAVVEVMEAAYRSAETGETIEMAS